MNSQKNRGTANAGNCPNSFLGARGKSLTARTMQHKTALAGYPRPVMMLEADIKLCGWQEGALSPGIRASVLEIKFKLYSPAIVTGIDVKIIFSIDKKSFPQINFAIGGRS